MIQTATPSTKPNTSASFTAAPTARPGTTTTTTNTTDSLADRIRRRAYEIFQARKGGPGNAHTDWLQAERELGLGSSSAIAAKSPTFQNR